MINYVIERVIDEPAHGPWSTGTEQARVDGRGEQGCGKDTRTYPMSSCESLPLCSSLSGFMLLLVSGFPSSDREEVRRGLVCRVGGDDG